MTTSADLNPKNSTFLTRVMTSRLFPGFFQWTVLILLLFGAWAALFASNSGTAESNFTLVFVWIFWGTVAPISMVMIGRYWCSMCPFQLIGNFVSRRFGKGKPIPRFFRHYGFWIALILFVVIVWFEHAVDIFTSPILTLVLLVPVLLGAIVGALFFRNIEWWCHGLCPLLPIARNYSMMSSLEVRATPSTCSQCSVKTCYLDGDDTYGCPVGLYPRTLDSMQDCIACGECFKSCPTPGTIQAKTRGMFHEFGRIRFPRMDAAMFAAIWPGLLAIHFFVLTPAGDEVMRGWMSTFGIPSYLVAWTLVYIIAIVASASLVAVSTTVSAVIAGVASYKKRFTRFSYAFIPLAVGIHTAFNMPRFFGEIGLNRVAHNFAGIFGYSFDGTVLVLGQGATQALMFVLLGAGMVASLAATGFMSKNGEGSRPFLASLPMVAVMAAFTVGIGAIFQIMYF